MLGFRLPRMVTMLLAGAFLVIALVLAGVYLWSPKATLRITTGPNGGMAQRFVSAFIANTEAAHPRIRFETVTVPDLTASSKALEERKVNIAIVRSDVSPPTNGQSLLILRRDVVAIVLPPGSPIESVGQLSGKTVAIPDRPGSKREFARAGFDLELFQRFARGGEAHFRGARAKLARPFERSAQRRSSPLVRSGRARSSTSSRRSPRRREGHPAFSTWTKPKPSAKRYPGFEEIDIPKGAFKGNPPVPDDDAKGVAVSYRFVVPTTMLNAVAGALARSILKTKAKLMALTPLANQIEAPDPDEKNPISADPSWRRRLPCERGSELL